MGVTVDGQALTLARQDALRASIGLRPTYQGLVATRCKVPTSALPSSKEVNSKTAHLAREDLTTFKVRMGNWYQQAASVADSALAGTTTFKVAVEWPDGVFTRATYQGSDSGAVSGLGHIDFDVTLATPMPKGSQFSVRVFASNPNGVLAHGYMSGALGDGAVFYTTTGNTDLSLGGTIGSAGAAWGPLAIIGPTRRSSVLLLGDSLYDGAAEDTTTDEDPDVGLAARWLGPSFAYSNLSQGGAALQTIISRATYRLTQVPLVTDVITNIMLNDLASGQGYSGTTKGRLATWIAAIRAQAGPQGLRVWYTTCSPLTATSSDNFATNANQTINANNAARVSFNTDLRNGAVPGIDGYFDASDWVEDVRDSGKFVTTGAANATVASDGVHMTGAMYRRAQEGLVRVARAELMRAA